MTEYLRVKNWETFQHYKDRRPPWVKLHVELTDDYAFTSLPDAAKYHLIGIWILAARTDNKIPDDAAWIKDKIGAASKVNVRELVDAGFLVPWENVTAGKVKWPSRYISAALREEILVRDLRRCRHCSSADNLEIDHIVPVSKGGTGVADNLQVLCRSCNRAKRVRVSAEHIATQTLEPAYPRGREETDTEKRHTDPPARKKPTMKVDGKIASEEEQATAHLILSAFNDVFERDFAAKEWVAKIVMRCREHPDLTVEEHRAVIERTAAAPWWTDSPSPAVVYGNAALFEKALSAVGAPVNGSKPNMKYGRRDVSGTEMRALADRLKAERLETERKALAPG